MGDEHMIDTLRKHMAAKDLIIREQKKIIESFKRTTQERNDSISVLAGALIKCQGRLEELSAREQINEEAGT